MKRIMTLSLVALSIYSCSGNNSAENESTNDSSAAINPGATQSSGSKASLQKAWETDTVFTTVESTLYDPADNIIYTSNIEGDPSKKDGKGSIGKLKPDGTVINARWATGLNAPKGMALMNGKLYVADVDELVEINQSDGKISKHYRVEGAGFLNDVATDGRKIYVSDTKTGRVHVLDNGNVRTVTEDRDGANGLACDINGQLYILDNKGLSKYAIDNKQNQFINQAVTGGDGLVILDDSTYLASRWQGEIYLIKGGKEQLLLDTKADSSNTADIGYIPAEKLVLVPTFYKNKVVAYKLSY
jgi:DNA-binding beta-propeller fold protein YncE